MKHRNLLLCGFQLHQDLVKLRKEKKTRSPRILQPSQADFLTRFFVNSRRRVGHNLAHPKTTTQMHAQGTHHVRFGRFIRLVYTRTNRIHMTRLGSTTCWPVRGGSPQSETAKATNNELNKSFMSSVAHRDARYLCAHGRLLFHVLQRCSRLRFFFFTRTIIHTEN